MSGENGKLILDLLNTLQGDEVALLYKTPEGDPLVVLMKRESVIIEENTEYEFLRVSK